MLLNREHIINNLSLTMNQFISQLDTLETLDITNFSKEDTLVIMIDMINGFCKLGPLHSDFVNALVPSMGLFLDSVIEREIPIISYRDNHPVDAKEFGYFPPHCVSGTEESSLVDELVRPELIDVPKNSTNGFLAQNPLELVDGKTIRHILIIGCVTDICVRDFAATMNKYLQQINQPGSLYIIENLVDTFHIEGIHDRQVEHVLALYQLSQSGVKLVRV